MTEQEAQDWVNMRFGAAALRRLEHFARLVAEENERQNLIAPSTIATIWVRHLLDSAQLLPLAPARFARWLDVGTGAGFPGIVIAALAPAARFTLVEPRIRRAQFLRDVVEALDIENVTVVASKVEAHASSPFDVITARAVSSTAALLDMTAHVRTPLTHLILPRGRQGRDEVAKLRRDWQGLFHVEQSLTDPESTIIVASGVG